ncbi:MAG TPA: alternative ribosome rescue aminoacyl-tRNA hydrolase ArfB [Aliidongia sp.]|uniref:alternative ribosome rescue aminoacyl-tRNA hydrolase ArfB n=1 Tax=Aliidongia sp. TaxID=1914230 RepID=UPI002DDCE25B|nr:alternative ribosome rescue aminoacyl-tRNA hydrolase ArfB [Aliidongia sp.]HEV2677186.1 alternative ribosome rescue aminoacyl-tRNA hydrolase ArfB [Aliidongia sp.]
MIEITHSIFLDERELDESFVRASGPGGQNVNKVSTAVELRWNVALSPALTEPVRTRLMKLAGRRLTLDGVLIIQADQFRSQDRNRQDALDRLIALVREAAIAPIHRRPTRPTLGSKKRRLESKGKRGDLKKLRSSKGED